MACLRFRNFTRKAVSLLEQYSSRERAIIQNNGELYHSGAVGNTDFSHKTPLSLWNNVQEVPSINPRSRLEAIDGRSRTFASVALSEKNWDGGEQMADDLIRYSNSQRHTGGDELVRVLEHGTSFLLSDGKLCETSAGRVLLALSGVQVDRGELSEAQNSLNRITSLEGSSLELKVATYESLCGLHLRLHQDQEASLSAKRAVELTSSSNLGENGDLASRNTLLSRALCTLAITEHLGGNYGTAVSVLCDAEHCHAIGRISHASLLYEKAMSLASSAEREAPHLAVAGPTADPREVMMAALAGIGQLAAHDGDLDKAEDKLSEAIRVAESLSGSHHSRVGSILSALASVFHKRAQLGQNSGALIIAEGLYRRSVELLVGNKNKDPEELKAEFSDLLALTRGRYSSLLRMNRSRESEADAHLKRAEGGWRAKKSLFKAMELNPQTNQISPNSQVQSTLTVIDVRFGRVL